eukprot:jgi/Chrzof1/13476/UNPLg00562.t1
MPVAAVMCVLCVAFDSHPGMRIPVIYVFKDCPVTIIGNFHAKFPAPANTTRSQSKLYISRSINGKPLPTLLESLTVRHTHIKPVCSLPLHYPTHVPDCIYHASHTSQASPYQATIPKPFTPLVPYHYRTASASVRYARPQLRPVRSASCPCCYCCVLEPATLDYVSVNALVVFQPASLHTCSQTPTGSLY